MFGRGRTFVGWGHRALALGLELARTFARVGVAATEVRDAVVGVSRLLLFRPRSLLVLLAFVLLWLAAAASATASSDYQTTVLGDSPSAYWRLGESSGTTFADSSGNSNALTITAPTSPDGVAGTYDASGDVTPDDGAYQFNFDNSDPLSGRFAPNPDRIEPEPSDGVHGNSRLSDQPTSLYQLYDSRGTT